MKRMKNWRIWQGSTEIQYDIVSVDIQHVISSMADVNLSLSDPDFTKTWLNHGSSINIYEGGIKSSGENCGTGNGVQTVFYTAHGTWQSYYIQLYIDGTSAGDEIAYTRVSSYSNWSGSTGQPQNVPRRS